MSSEPTCVLRVYMCKVDDGKIVRNQKKIGGRLYFTFQIYANVPQPLTVLQKKTVLIITALNGSDSTCLSRMRHFILKDFLDNFTMEKMK